MYRPRGDATKRGVSSGSTLFAIHPAIFLTQHWVVNGKELMCLNTKGKYSKVTGTEIKGSIITKSVTIIFFVEFIDQLNRLSD